MGKKRKAPLVDLEGERTLYHSFVGAANAVSQLYTQAAQQQRQAASAAARQALERVICHVLRESANGDAISRSSLLQFLQQEYESMDGPDAQPSTSNFAFPGMHLPQGLGGEEQHGMVKNARSGSLFSPARRAAQHGTAGMDMQDGEQQHQQHQQAAGTQPVPGFSYGQAALPFQGPHPPGATQNWMG